MYEGDNLANKMLIIVVKIIQICEKNGIIEKFVKIYILYTECRLAPPIIHQ